MKKVICTLFIGAILLSAPAIPIIAKTAEHYCPMFEAQETQSWNPNNKKWEATTSADGFLILAVVASYVSLIGLIILIANTDQ